MFSYTLTRGAAAYGGRKVRPWQVRFCCSTLPLPLSHIIDRHIEGKTPYTCKTRSSCNMALAMRHTSKYATCIYVTTGIPYRD